MTSEFRSQLAGALPPRYVLGEEVGHGGMGIVYRAKDRDHTRDVAIKALKPDVMASVGAERFDREISVAARLQHPNIVALIDSGTAADVRYYVMPFIEGESLGQRIDRLGVLPVDEAIQIAIELADALAYAHRRNVVHRDVKPGNVLLANGHAHLLDFGLAQLDVGDTTMAFSAAGTPSYMSPEQASGVVTKKADVFSLGAVLYEMLLGETPLGRRARLGIAGGRPQEGQGEIRSQRPELPKEVENAIRAALNRNPEKRFRDAGELMTALMPAARREPRRSLRPRPSLVVGSFENQSSPEEGDLTYLSEGLAEDLTEALAQFTGIRVCPRGALAPLGEAASDPRTLAAELDIDYLVEGRVTVLGSSLRIRARMIDARRQSILWTESLAGEFADVFELQERLASRISRSVARTVSAGFTTPKRERLVRHRTESEEAYRRYLRARALWKRRTEQDLIQSLELFRAALYLDPGFAPAHAGVAEALVMLAGPYGVRDPAAAMPEAEAAAERALEIDSELASAYAARASVRAIYRWSWAEAGRDFEDSIQLSPDHATSHQWHAMHYFAPLGLYEAAQSELEQAERLEPSSPVVMCSQGLLHLVQGRHDAARERLSHSLEVNPDFALAHYFLGQVDLDEEHFVNALHSLERARKLAAESVEIQALLGYALGRAGQRDRAFAVLDDLERQAESRYVSPYRLAQVRLGLGNVDAALDDLEKAVANRAGEVIWLRVHSCFRILEDRLRFRALLGQIGLTGPELPTPLAGLTSERPTLG